MSTWNSAALVTFLVAGMTPEKQLIREGKFNLDS